MDSERLFKLYRGLERARGVNTTSKELDVKGKRKSKNLTVHKSYSAINWVNHLAGKEGLGVVPITDDAICYWGAIDIDEYPLDLIALEQQVKSLRLPFVVLRTKSGGAHLVCFFKDEQKAKDVRNKMAEVCFAMGLGNREIYPKQVKLANTTDTGNWLNMPYFNGDNTERYAVIDGIRATLSEFITFAENISVSTVEEIKIIHNHGPLSDGPPCLEKLVLSKSKPGERNNTLFNLGVYSRLKWESDWQTELEKFNIEYIDPPLSHKEVGALLKSLEKKSYTYGCNNSPLCENCNREVCKAREFGISAFQHIDVGVTLDGITKLNSDPPMWIISLDGIRTEIETDDLLEQSRFRKVCTNVVNKLPGRMKPDEWDKFVRTKLTEVEVVDAPKETRQKDQVIHMLAEFIRTTPPGRNERDARLGRWVRNGVGYIVSGDTYCNYLERINIKVDKRKIWVALMQLGVTVDDRDLWHIPYTSIDINDEVVSRPEKPVRSEVAF